MMCAKSRETNAKRLSRRPGAAAVGLAGILVGALGLAGSGLAGDRLQIDTAAGYVPGLPVLVRVECRDETGRTVRGLWDAEAELAVTQPGVVLSTNRVQMRNGMGSALVSFAGANGNLELVATLGTKSAQRVLTALNPQTAVSVGGVLPGTATTWSGLIRVTNDVIVSSGHVLTIQPGTWVLFNGVATGTNGADLQINGELRSLGTAEAPVIMTCATEGLRWGQIRHAGARPSLYTHTMVTLGGRARGEGHTGQAPVIRSTNSRITFQDCSVTDHATPAGTPGKIMQATGSDVVMTNCLLSRARMGPEIEGTSLQFIDSYVIDTRGPDDADGIYLHSQGANQVIHLAGSVVAGGDDDGIDTLGANITVEDCIVRGWKFPGDDSKGISVFGGECRLSRSLLVDNTIGLSGKGGNNENVRVRIDRSTIVGNSYGIAVTNKSGTTPIIDYRITNSIIVAPDPVFTQYEPGDIHIDYSLVGEDWPGTGNLTGEPGFVDASLPDLRLRPFSPCIDAGDPLSGLDSDGTRVELGALPFVAPAPELVGPLTFAGQQFGFTLKAYPNRSYVLEISTNAVSWERWRTEVPATGEMRVEDPGAARSGVRYYRARTGL